MACDDRIYGFHDGLAHRRIVLRALLAFTVFWGVVFTVFNMQRGSYRLAMVELGMSVMAGVIFLYLPRIRHLGRLTLLYSALFFGTMLFAFTSRSTADSVFVWVTLVPILSHLLLGRWLGLIGSLVFMCSAAMIYVWRYQNVPGAFEPLRVIDVVICSLCVLGFAHVYEISRESTEARLRRMAFYDPLTGLANRARFRDVFEHEREQALSHARPLSLMIIDLDHFKHINDNFGHDAGDTTLFSLAELLRGRLRRSDLACRLGGEEFGILMPATNIGQAMAVAEDLRTALDAARWDYQGYLIHITMTVGVAELGDDGDQLKSLFAAADRRLYRGKSAGRNRVVGPGDYEEEGFAPEPPMRSA